MAAAAGERLSEFRLGFGRDSSRLEVNIFFEKRTKNLEKKDVFRLLINYVVRAVALTTSPSSLLWLVVALSYCVQRELERQPFIPPTLPMEQRQTRHLSDVGLACQANTSWHFSRPQNPHTMQCERTSLHTQFDVILSVTRTLLLHSEHSPSLPHISIVESSWMSAGIFYVHRHSLIVILF